MNTAYHGSAHQGGVTTTPLIHSVGIQKVVPMSLYQFCSLHLCGLSTPGEDWGKNRNQSVA